jgi:hypothetical protein
VPAPRRILADEADNLCERVATAGDGSPIIVGTDRDVDPNGARSAYVFEEGTRRRQQTCFWARARRQEGVGLYYDADAIPGELEGEPVEQASRPSQ